MIKPNGAQKQKRKKPPEYHSHDRNGGHRRLRSCGHYHSDAEAVRCRAKANREPGR